MLEIIGQQLRRLGIIREEMPVGKLMQVDAKCSVVSLLYKIVMKLRFVTICLQTARKFCPHHVGHYLGMDVHDTDTISRMRPLASGMVVTIEPGDVMPYLSYCRVQF